MVFRIDELRWDDRNEEHIARHGVVRDEVEALIFDYLYFVRRVSKTRYRLVGRTDGGRMLTVFVDRDYSAFRVVTARDATADERRLYLRHTNS